jgi:tetratricopeptide (TPR) repeat protein
VISLLIGAGTLKGLYQGWHEKREAVRELVRAGNILSESGDYRTAWDLYEQALELEPSSQLARRGQVDLGMHWLQDIRIIGGEETFAEITEWLIPVLSRGAASSKGASAANCLAHVGYAYYLQRREKPIFVNVNAIYRKALELDPDNVYAHTMWGHWLLYKYNDDNEENLEEARKHFRKALQSGRKREYIRGRQLSALTNPILLRYRTSADSTFRAPELAEIMKETLRVANEMRENAEPLPDDHIREQILRNYGRGYLAEYVDMLLPALAPEDHLATIHWLDDGLKAKNANLKPQTKFVIAHITEEMGDRSGALQIYRELGSQNIWRKELKERALQAIERLTGEIRPRKRTYINDILDDNTDPWEFHAETLGNFDPGFRTKNFKQALEFFVIGVMEEKLTDRTDEVIALLEKASRRVKHWIEDKEVIREQLGGTFTGEYTKGIQKLARENEYLLWSDLGLCYLENGQLAKAISKLNAVVLSDLHDGHPTKRTSHYNLACAYCQRSLSYGHDSQGKALRDADLTKAMDHLEKAGPPDFEYIKSDSSLDPLRSMDRYKAFIATK